MEMKNYARLEFEGRKQTQDATATIKEIIQND